MLQVAAETPRLVAMRCASSRSSGKPFAPGFSCSADEMRVRGFPPDLKIELNLATLTILSKLELDFPEIRGPISLPKSYLFWGNRSCFRSLSF